MQIQKSIEKRGVAISTKLITNKNIIENFCTYIDLKIELIKTFKITQCPK